MALLGVGGVWVAKHAPVPSNHPSASQLARDRRFELAYHALQAQIAADARRARTLERARNRWVRRANKICGSVARADWAAFRRVTRTRSQAEALDILATVEFRGRSVLDELEALRPPPGRTARRIRRMLGLYEKTYALDQEAFAALRRSDRSGVARILQQEIPLAEQADEIARDLGANVCADGVFADPAG